MEFQLDTDNKEFQDALQLITHTRQSVFLTGKAGTGKSTFLKYICAHTKKKYVVLAPTGIAAINAEGVTLHSFFKLPFRPMLPDDPDLSLKNGRIFEFFKYRKEHRKLISEVELIIIDEISMVRADIIDCVDRILRVFSGNMRLPFGGKQLLFVGDVFQLEPVVPADQKEILSLFYASPFFFSARVFKDINLVPIELQKVYKSRKTKSDGREKRKAIFEAKTKCAQKSRLLPPSGQNTSVVQTPFESCLKDAFLLNFLLKYHLKTHCQFSKKSYLYIVVMLPLCIPSRPHS